jgi:hypothetical protein
MDVLHNKWTDGSSYSIKFGWPPSRGAGDTTQRNGAALQMQAHTKSKSDPTIRIF